MTDEFDIENGVNHFTLQPLPYNYNLLEPVISAETLHYHHDQHHQSYVDKLNQLLPHSDFASSSLEQIVRHADGELFNNAAQHWNHDFFWKSMAPKGRHRPRGELLSNIDLTFGSFENFKNLFQDYGTKVFGSGWIWLVMNNKGELQILTTSNADNPLRKNLIPLFNCDLWEHAYYIDYRHDRKKYLSAFWHVLNWSFAETNFTGLNASIIREEPRQSAGF